MILYSSNLLPRALPGERDGDSSVKWMSEEPEPEDCRLCFLSNNLEKLVTDNFQSYGKCCTISISYDIFMKFFNYFSAWIIPSIW